MPLLGSPEQVLLRCMAAGVVKGKGFTVDASIIKADASRQRDVAGDEVDWRDPVLSTCAVHDCLEALDEEALAEALHGGQPRQVVRPTLPTPPTT